MATILHAYANYHAAKEAFRASAILGKRLDRQQTILKNDGTLVKFAVVANGRDAECLAGCNISEIYWHYQPAPEVEARLNRWVRKVAN
jgi:hypothetical protein